MSIIRHIRTALLPSIGDECMLESGKWQRESVLFWIDFTWSWKSASPRMDMPCWWKDWTQCFIITTQTDSTIHSYSALSLYSLPSHITDRKSQDGYISHSAVMTRMPLQMGMPRSIILCIGSELHLLDTLSHPCKVPFAYHVNRCISLAVYLFKIPCLYAPTCSLHIKLCFGGQCRYPVCIVLWKDHVMHTFHLTVSYDDGNVNGWIVW